MKHRVKGSKLSRDVHHRRALRKNLITAFLTHGRIKTTQAKAKVVRPEIDRLMSKAKEGSVHSRRQIDAVLNQRRLVNKLVDELAPKTKRKSGFTRMIRLGRRQGDDAMMVRLEWVDIMTDQTNAMTGEQKVVTKAAKSGVSKKAKAEPKKPKPKNAKDSSTKTTSRSTAKSKKKSEKKST